MRTDVIAGSGATKQSGKSVTLQYSGGGSIAAVRKPARAAAFVPDVVPTAGKIASAAAVDKPVRGSSATGKLVRAAAFVPAFGLAIGLSVGLAIGLSVGLAGCAPRTSQSVAADVSPAGWSEPVEMRYENVDTVSMRELKLSLRHNAAAVRTEGRYLLWSVSPSGAITSDTLAVAIAPDARVGNRLSETAAAARPAHLAEQGGYRFTVTPLQNTVGVWSVGLTLIETSDGQR